MFQHRIRMMAGESPNPLIILRLQEKIRKRRTIIDKSRTRIHRSRRLCADFKQLYKQSFLWFSPAPVSGGGVIASLPPLAHFVNGSRYLVFLRRSQTGYVVTMPIYSIEVRLAPAPHTSLSDMSQAPNHVRESEMAQELETAALSVQKPAPGVTGEAAIYFPYVVDLIGGCAEPFLRHFAESQSKELAGAAQRWLALLADKGLQCNVAAQ